jgi:hypothetical protein
MSKLSYVRFTCLLLLSCLASKTALATQTADSVALPPSGASCQNQVFDFAKSETGWKHVPISKLKRDTRYTIEQDGNDKVLRAQADRSASFYVSRLKKPTSANTSLQWRWKTDALIPGADNRNKKLEDSPLRIVLGFDGDLKSLPAAEQKQFARAKTFSTAVLPYATLMYIWSEQVPVETIIPSAHSSQVKMLVVASGTEGLGQWNTIKRNVTEDYRRAFASAPGKLLGIAVMSDTDNTGQKALGWYADISLSCL